MNSMWGNVVKPVERLFGFEHSAFDRLADRNNYTEACHSALSDHRYSIVDRMQMWADCAVSGTRSLD